MEKLEGSLRALLFLVFLYLVVGLSVHIKIVGEPPSPNYYHNIAVGVILGSLIATYLVLLVVLINQPHLIRENFRPYLALTIVISLLGIILSTGTYGGSFVTPDKFGVIVPGNLVVLGLIHRMAGKRIEAEKDTD